MTSANKIRWSIDLRGCRIGITVANFRRVVLAVTSVVLSNEMILAFPEVERFMSGRH